MGNQLCCEGDRPRVATLKKSTTIEAVEETLAGHTPSKGSPGQKICNEPLTMVTQSRLVTCDVVEGHDECCDQTDQETCSMKTSAAPVQVLVPLSIENEGRPGESAVNPIQEKNPVTADSQMLAKLGVHPLDIAHGDEMEDPLSPKTLRGELRYTKKRLEASQVLLKLQQKPAARKKLEAEISKLERRRFTLQQQRTSQDLKDLAEPVNCNATQSQVTEVA